MTEFRPSQQKAIIQVLKAIKAGKTDILLQAPTGTGKSLIAMELAKILYDRKGWKSFILTSEKLLQQQYEKDSQEKYDRRYKDLVSISGIDNYNCHINEEKFSLGHCRSMGMSNRQALALPCAATCQYLQRWSGAQAASTSVFNYSYYLLQMNYVLRKMGEYAPFKQREVIFCDEAHSLPDVIENHFACYVDKSMTHKIREAQRFLETEGIATQFRNIPTASYNRRVDSVFRLTLSDNENHIKELVALHRLHRTMMNTANDAKKDLAERFKVELPDGSDSESYIKASKDAMDNVPKSVLELFSVADELKDYDCKLEDYIEIMQKQGVHNMVVESTKTRRVYHNLSDHKLFEQHFQPFSQIRIYMSATLQAENLIERWNLDPDDLEVITLNSGWDPKNSPVVLRNAANFSHWNKDEALDAAVSDIDAILDKHPNERGIIHTTTYAITEALIGRCKNRSRLIDYQGTREKMQILEDLETFPENGVLLGPSLTQGVDLPDDLARFNIIVKLSYPDISSKLWSARLKIKKNIYLAETANRLEQSSGRSTRHRMINQRHIF